LPGHWLGRGPRAAGERRLRGPALLHSQWLPDHHASAPRGGPLRPHRAPRVLDPPHPPDLAALLPHTLDRIRGTPRAEWTPWDSRLPRHAPHSPPSLPGIPG